MILAGLAPIMWSVGTGTELMQRIAAPMIGGMITAPLPRAVETGVEPAREAAGGGAAGAARGAAFLGPHGARGRA